MTTKPLILAAAALTAGFFALGTPTAEAGGVRLSFGGPLGSFTARPSHGYAPSYGAPGCDKPKSYSSAARYSKPEPKKPVSVASRKHDDDDDEKPAKAKRKVETAKSERSEKVAKTEKSSKSDTSSAPNQIASNAIPLPAVKADVPVTEPNPAPAKSDAEPVAAGVAPASTAAPAPTNTALLTTAAATPDLKAEPAPQPKAETKPQAKTETKPAKTAEKKTDCRRFNPTAGITISVRCND